MSFDPHDPKWTAYVVGELNERERESVENELRSSPAARRMVDELRTLADSVKMAVANEPMPGLSREQRRGLLSAATAPAAPAVEPSKQLAASRLQPWGQIVFAFAAGLLIAAFCLPALQSAQRNIRIAQAPAGDHNARVQRHKMLVDALSQAELSAIPFPDDEGPLVYPDARRWQELTLRRKQYTAGDSTLAAGADAAGDRSRGLAGAPLDPVDLRAETGIAAPAPERSAGRVKGEDVAETPIYQAGVRKRDFHAGPPQTAEPNSVAPNEERDLLTTDSYAAHDRPVKDKKDVPYTINKPIYDANTPASEPPTDGATASGRKRVAGAQMLAQVGQVKTFDIKPYRPGVTGYDAPDPQNMATAYIPTHEQEKRVTTKPASTASPYLNLLEKGYASAGLSPYQTLVQPPPQAFDGRFCLAAGALDNGVLPRSPADAEQNLNTEAYEPITDNPFLRVADNALSTFSVDVDTASYSNLRRFLLQNRQLPPRSAVRIEELINYFPYQYAPPENKSEDPFAVHAEVAACPWNGGHRLLRIGIKGREIAADRRPATNLVFLLDVSGSMDDPHKLPLVKDAMRLLVKQLTENDRVAIVVYAGASGLALPSTTGDQKTKILAAIDSLQPGGSTNGAQGIELAYDIAAGNLIKGGANRVILATDGDFNVGVTDRGELIRLIEEKAKTGVFLTALGFGMGNLKDNTLEQLADKGNGAYAYIDNLREARKVFVEQLSGTLVTIAKDVKLQLEFNPAQVAEYRLIGYENRALKNEDFNDDKKDAGDIGAGHTVTALYELVPTGKTTADKAAADRAATDKAATAGAAPIEPAKVDALKYTQPATLTAAAQSGELLTLKLRYKQPEGSESRLIERSVKDDGRPYAAASVDFKFASAVALFGMLLRDSPYRGSSSFDAALELAQEGRGDDPAGYRAEFFDLVRAAKQLKGG